MKGGAQQWLLSRKWLSGPDLMAWGTSMAFHLFALQRPTHLSPSAIMKGQGDCFKTPQNVLISIFCPITFSRLYYFDFKFYLWIQIQSIISSPLTFFFLTQNQETQEHKSPLKAHRTPKLWWLRLKRKSQTQAGERTGHGLHPNHPRMHPVGPDLSQCFLNFLVLLGLRYTFTVNHSFSLKAPQPFCW